MIHLLGLPYDKNSSFLRGPALAPPRIRQMARDGSANLFSERGLEVKEGTIYNDLGDVSFRSSDPESVFHQIRDNVSNTISKKNRLLCFGGDHSVSYPIIDAHADLYEHLNILQFDAHSDLYNDFDGNLYSHASPFARLMETGKIESLTQVGIRTLNDHQREQAEKFGVNITEMKDFSTKFLSDLKEPLYISLDLDVLDPAFAPGISHHEPGGLSTRQLIDLIHGIDVPVIGADIVEYNPTRDINDMTVMVSYKLFKELAELINRNV